MTEPDTFRKGRRKKTDWLEYYRAYNDNKYYRATSRGPAWDTLTKALSLFDAEGFEREERFAIDLGCGSGRDTFELLRRGWKVLAVDNEPEAIRWVRSVTLAKYRGRLETRLVSFERVRLPKSDLVNASYSLPFCPPDHFDSFWRKILASIRPRGRFAGHFFGEHDEWASDSNLTFHSAARVKAILRQLKTEFLAEKEWNGTTAQGQRKHWHVFSVVARKP